MGIYGRLLILLAVPFLLATTPTVTGPVDVPASYEGMLPRIGHWKYTPTVILCQGAPADVASVERAVRWWADRGYPFFSTVSTEDAPGECRAEFPVGFITIKVGHQQMFTDGDDLAETHFDVDDETREITWAKVYLRGRPLERVVEHELGHALGFIHTQERGHLMHRSWIRGGWNDRGLRSKSIKPQGSKTLTKRNRR